MVGQTKEDIKGRLVNFITEGGALEFFLVVIPSQSFLKERLAITTQSGNQTLQTSG